MRILIFGGAGMLGHKAYQLLSKNFDTFVTFRNYNNNKLSNTNIFNKLKIVDKIDVFNFESVKNILDEVRPEVVLNCIGIIKQLKESENHITSIYVNSLFPHILAEYCEKFGCKLIHISTDCVFSGNQGNYSDDSDSDAEDLYGKTKYLGEVNYGKTLTLRTSIIGHELFTSISLVDWFLSQKEKVIYGYTNAIYTGFPTITFVNELIRIIKEYPELSGLFNLSSDKISKYELLQIINNVYNLKIKLKPYPDFYCDRSLDSTTYKNITGFVPAKWVDMVEEMYEDYLINKNKGIYNV